MKVWGIAGLMVVATVEVVWAQVKTGTTVNAYPENTLQDGRVADAPDDQFLADDGKIVVEAPYQLIQLTKTFTPPERYKFRKFRANEKVIADRRLKRARTRRYEAWLLDEAEYVDSVRSGRVDYRVLGGRTGARPSTQRRARAR